MNRLKQLRQENNKKQTDIAKLLNVEFSAISKYETDRVPLKDEHIKLLCEYFNVSSDYLLCLSNIRNYDIINKELDLLGIDMSQYQPPTEEEKEKMKLITDAILRKKDNK